MSANRAYGIGEISDIVGVSTRTLRYYEEEGLLVPARTANGYRRYTPADLDRLQEILLLRHRGLSILSGVLSIVAGIAVFMFPLESVDLMIVFSGIALAVLGGVLLVRAFTFGKISR